MATPKRKAATETGQIPRLDPSIPLPEEPLLPLAPPPSLPEVAEPQSATGVVRIVSEGADAAEDADDPVKRPY